MYDVIIVGGGPGGLTAAIYLSRAGRRVALIEKILGGGQAGQIVDIVNYPGIKKTTGFDLVYTMTEQAESFGCERISGEVTAINANKPSVSLTDGRTIEASAIILATGCKAKSLGLAHEDELVGSGVSYCATCDGGFFRGKSVAVAGSGNKAKEAAEYLTGVANKVYLISKSGDSVPKAESVLGTVTALVGKPLAAVEVVLEGGLKRTIEVACLFIEAGFVPLSHLVVGVVETNERGFVVTDENMRSSHPNIYAVGDVREKSTRQIVTAAADGAIAADHILKNFKRRQD